MAAIAGGYGQQKYKHMLILLLPHTLETEGLEMSTQLGLRFLAIGLAILLGGCSMGSLMIHEQRSPYDFDTTVATIVKNATARGWVVAKTFNFQESLLAHGEPDPGPMTVIRLCAPRFATRMFASDDTKFVSVMAPCGISVYDKSDGQTYVATMNMGLMAQVMGSQIGPVLAEIAVDDAAIVGFTQDSPAHPTLAIQ